MDKLTKTVTRVINVTELAQILTSHYQANTITIQAIKHASAKDHHSPMMDYIGVGGILSLELDIVVPHDREL